MTDTRTVLKLSGRFGAQDKAAAAQLAAANPVPADMADLKLAGPPATHVRTIDMTPTWAGILPVLLLCVENSSPEGAQIAREELLRMAKLADLYVASQTEA